MELLQVIFGHPFLISLAIAGFGFTFLFYFFVEIRSVINDLRALKEQVKQSKSLEELNLKKIRNFRINQLITAYKRQLKEPPAVIKEAGYEIISGTEAGNFFNENEVFPTGLPFYKAMPSILTGCGILMTFCGIAVPFWGDFGFHGNLDLNSFERLLLGAGLAFSTSIAGIFCSLVFVSILKISLGKCRRSLSSLCFLLDEKFPVLGSEEYDLALVKSIDSLRFGFREDFSKALSVTLARFNERMVSSMETLTKTFEETAGNIKSSTDLLMNEFSAYEANLNNGNKAISSQITELLTSWNACGTQFENSCKSIGGCLDNFAIQLKSLGNEYKESQTEYSRVIEEELSHMRATVDGLLSPIAKLVDQEREIKERNEELLKQLISSTSNISSFTLQVRKELAEPLLDSNKQLLKVTQTVVEDLTAVNGNFKKIFEQHEEKIVLQKAISTKLEGVELANRTQQVDIASLLELSRKDLGVNSTLMRNVNQLVEKINKDNGNQLTQTVKEIVGILEKIDTLVKENKELQERSLGVLSDLSKNRTDANNKFSDQVELLTRITKELKEVGSTKKGFWPFK